MSEEANWLHQKPPQVPDPPQVEQKQPEKEAFEVDYYQAHEEPSDDFSLGKAIALCSIATCIVIFNIVIFQFSSIPYISIECGRALD